MFKKILVLPLILLTLCGCLEKRTVMPILNDITFTAEIDYGEDEFVCDLFVSDGALKVILNEPEEIKDLTLIVNKNGVTAEFKGVTYTPDINSMPQGAFVKLLFNILNDISNNDSLVCDDENCKITGRLDGYEYEFTFSPSGLPISLYIDQIDLKIDFKNVTVN